MFMLAARLVYPYVIDKLAAWRWLVPRAVHPRGSVERVQLEEKRQYGTSGNISRTAATVIATRLSSMEAY